MLLPSLHLLLADDDIDDCSFFTEALEELPLETSLKTVYDGEQMMEYLDQNQDRLPHAIYLDLNMPRKNGNECLAEIKRHEKYRNICVIIYSTSYNPEIAGHLRQQGASYYIRKPADFSELRDIIRKSLTLVSAHTAGAAADESFLITSDNQEYSI